MSSQLLIKKEVTYDIEDFLNLIDPRSRIRYTIKYRSTGGIRWDVLLEAYALSMDGHIVKLELHKTIDALRTPGGKSAEQLVKESIDELRNIAEGKLRAKPGRWEL